MAPLQPPHTILVHRQESICTVFFALCCLRIMMDTQVGELEVLGGREEGSPQAWLTKAVGMPCWLVRQQPGSRRSLSPATRGELASSIAATSAPDDAAAAGAAAPESGNTIGELLKAANTSGVMFAQCVKIGMDPVVFYSQTWASHLCTMVELHIRCLQLVCPIRQCQATDGLHSASLPATCLAAHAPVSSSRETRVHRHRMYLAGLGHLLWL